MTVNGIYFVNGHRGIQKALKTISNRPFSYLVLKHYLFEDEAKSLSLAGGNPIPAQDIFRKVNRDFGEDVVEWMGDLNNSRESPFWNRLNLAGKRVHATRFCEHVFYVTCLNRVLEDFSEDIVVVVDDPVIIRQTRNNWKHRPVHDWTRKGSLLYRFFMDVLPGKMVHRFCVALGRKCISGPIPLSKERKRLVVVKTVVSKGSFDRHGDYHDPYFGDLLNYFEEIGRNVVVIGNVIDSYRKFLRGARRAASVTVCSVEQWLGFGDLIVCFVQTLGVLSQKIFSPRGTYLFRGISMKQVVRACVMEEVRSDQYFLSVMNERATKKLVERWDVERFILPFENRGFERSDMRAIRAHSKKTRIIGYQHATITRTHTEYFRSRNDHMSLPDVVISSGEITAKILTDLGLFPKEIVKTGCALRQRGPYILNFHERSGPLRFLVILTASRDYYHRVIAVINSVYQKGMDCSFRLCPHPMIPLDKELRSKIQFPLVEDASWDQERMIDWADVAIYSSSTLAIRCLQRGKPLFYFPVDDFLDADPLFELADGKWTICSTADFNRAMAEVRSLDEDQWRERLSRAQAFVRRYFGPVSKSMMNLFIE